MMDTFWRIVEASWIVVFVSGLEATLCLPPWRGWFEHNVDLLVGSCLKSEETMAVSHFRDVTLAVNDVVLINNDMKACGKLGWLLLAL